MSIESVQVVAGGRVFEGWTSVAVRAALPECYREFSIAVTEVPWRLGPFDLTPFEVWHFPPGTPVQVLATGTLMLDGYVHEYQPSGDASNHSVTITGHGRGYDYATCACVHETGHWEDAPVEAIARALDVFGIGIRMLAAPARPVEWFQMRRGSTPHAEIMRLLPSRRLTMRGDASGEMSIMRAGSRRHASGLVQGDNILAMSATLSDDRYSEVRAIGQSPLGVEPWQLQPSAKVTDPAVQRFRPWEIIEQRAADPDSLHALAETFRNRTIGVTREATITVPGFRDAAGELWDCGNLVFVMAPWLKLHQDMLVRSVDFTQDDQGGTTSTLSLVDPRAFGGAAPAASETGVEWGLGAP